MGAKRPFYLAGAFLVSLALGCDGWLAAATAQQLYPNRPVKMVVPYDAGGPGDIVARTLADKLSISLKQPFVIENRPGAGGNIGTDVVAKAAPDGYTLGLVVSTTLTVNPSLYKKLPFDPEKDIRPISIVTTTGLMLAVHASVPVNSVAKFVDYAKAAAARKEPIAYASAGNGTPSHLAMERFRLHAGFEAIPVPYRSVAPMIVDLVAGQVKVGFVATSSMDHVQAGRLKVLGTARLSRSPLVPDVPTIAESGYPDFSADSYNVVLAPAGVPNTVLTLLEREVQAALKLPDVIERFRLMDTSSVGIIGPEVKARLKADRATWEKVIAAAHMRLD
jgi:tripartite-type tricarboxylate transporter receptor subunit TctC